MLTLRELLPVSIDHSMLYFGLATASLMTLPIFGMGVISWLKGDQKGAVGKIGGGLVIFLLVLSIPVGAGLYSASKLRSALRDPDAHLVVARNGFDLVRHVPGVVKIGRETVSMPDKRLYQLSVDEAVELAKILGKHPQEVMANLSLVKR